MNAQRLLQHFNRIAEAPDAVPRLRRFILDLAVRGKLVEQDPRDEQPLSRLKKPNVKVETNDEPFDIPESWTWASVADVAECRLGKMLDKAKNKGIPRRYLRNLNVRWFDFDLSDVMEMRFEDSELTEFGLRRGDVLICEGGEPGRAAVWDEREADIYFQKAIHRVRVSNRVDPHFFVIVLRVSADSGDLATYFTGVGIKHFTGKGLSVFQFPLPPLVEQRRIVAKVAELIALCDRLEEAQAERETRRDRLVAASLHRLNTGGDADTFREHARFHLRHLPRFTTRPEHIQQLRQTILNLAVRGKLVPQDPNDGPAPDFDAGASLGLALPFQIPDSWRWSRLQSLGRLKGGGTPSKSQSAYWNGTIPWVSPKDMKRDYIDTAQLAITEDAVAESAANMIEPKSILFVVRGMILAHSFPVAIARVALTINQDMKALVLHIPDMSEFILRVLKGLKPQILSRVQRSSHGTCRIEGRHYRDLLVPVPPILEQQRIVARVDELMRLCDQMEAGLATTSTTAGCILEANLHRAFAVHRL